MMNEIEARISEILHTSGQLMVPLSVVRAKLGRAATGGVPSLRLLRDRIAQRADLFRLIEPHAFPWDTEHWSAESRDAYRSALRSNGLIPEPTVALADPFSGSIDGGPNRLARQLDATLLCLWDRAPDDDDTMLIITEALLETQELRAEMTELMLE